MPLLNMGRPWNIQEAIYSSIVIWDRNGKRENIWAKWESREEKRSNNVSNAHLIIEEMGLVRKQVSLHPECEPNPVLWAEIMVTAMCFLKKAQWNAHAVNSSIFVVLNTFLFNLWVFHTCIQWVFIKSTPNSLSPWFLPEALDHVILLNSETYILTHWV